MNQVFEHAKQQYAEIGVDVEKAMTRLSAIPISMHCWQGDDIQGFENLAGPVSGGIQATGDYPGRARNGEELMMDIDKAFSLIPGKHRLNLHASYGFFGESKIDRDQIRPEHFDKWIDFALERGICLDFNATCFSHPLSKDGTLSSEQTKVRDFWIAHVKACLKISEHIAHRQRDPVTLNIWIPDGFKDIPADRFGPRRRLKDSLDQILAADYDRSLVNLTVESKVFGIGLESYTVGSHEFYLNYAAQNGIIYLLDNGHFHPTEVVADKISSTLLFFDKVALHMTRPVRWDSDHVVRLDDEILGLAQEIIVHGEEHFLLGTDFFDASVNRVAAWVIGMRNVQKALLIALLQPHDQMRALQDARNLSKLLALQEELKTYPFGIVWQEFCQRSGVPTLNWYPEIEKYEEEVTKDRKAEDEWI
ncbi:MAG: L-rhamnose isomerase [Tissierellia bacterium]|nr:L-rhamnose isomerase [Tissierellia bacterium]